MVYVNNNRHYSPATQKIALIVGVIAGVVAVAVGLTCLCLCGGRSSSRRNGNDIESQRDQHRAQQRNWYRQPSPVETTVERRARQAREARASRCEGSGIETQARREREAREGGPAPPVYQLPVPAHHSVLQSSVQHDITGRPLPNPHSTSAPAADAPPAYDSPAVWSNDNR